MRRTHRNEQGFSAVELLITLFIAATFIMTGYQLFSVVLNGGNNTRLRSRASNVAYENLQKYRGLATVPCTVPTPPTGIPLPPDLPAAEVIVTFSCPYSGTSSTTRIQAVVKYGVDTPKSQVLEAIYVTQ